MLRKTSKTAYCRIRQARKYSVSGGGARWKLDETTFAQVGPPVEVAKKKRWMTLLFPLAPLCVLRRDNDGKADCDDVDESLNGRAGLRSTPTTKDYGCVIGPRNHVVGTCAYSVSRARKNE